jgi:CubicO group peptidase (beta-lactamase class C family)
MKNSVCRLTLVLGCALAPASARSQSLDTAAMRTVVDSVITDAMRAQHIPGAAVIVVHQGRVVHQRGFGVQDPSSRVPVSPDSTLFAIGSITKLFTATAAMQLVEQGRVGLDTDLSTVLRGVRIPEAAGGPVTLRALLSHTAGFDEIRPGTQASDSAGVERLAAFLGPRLVRSRGVGEIPSYSTYGITLAGLLVEELRGQRFEEALHAVLLAPLGLQSTVFDPSRVGARHLAPGFEWNDSINVAQPREWYHTTPASSLHSTAADMGRFLLAHLGQGLHPLPASLRTTMQRAHGRGHPQVPGVALGWFEGDYRGQRVLEHGGAVAGTSAHLVMLPELGLGWFLASHHEANGLGERLKQVLIDRFFARAVTVPAPDPSRVPALQRFAGRYRWDVYCRSCGRPAPTQGPQVSVNSDGTIAFAGRRWIPRDSLLFVQDNGASVLGFRANAAGAITHLFIDGPITFERIP